MKVRYWGALRSPRSIVAVLLVLTSAVCVLLWVKDLAGPSIADPPVARVPPALAAAPGVSSPDGAGAGPRPEPASPDHRGRERRTSDVPPAALGIPTIDVVTPLINLGFQADGTVEVPDDPDRAGWFEPGTVPGAVGSSVILGHVDSSSGPAVFYRLGELVAGDAIWIRRDDDTAAKFLVRRVRTYEHDEVPAQRLYAAPRHRRLLNLITCGGVYDAARGGYQANVVVFARRARSDVVTTARLGEGTDLQVSTSSRRQD